MGWFGLLTCLVLLTKAVINLKCLLFCLGMPGLFGRNFLIHGDSLQDNFDKKIFCVTTNPLLVLLNTFLVVLKLVFILPIQWLYAFCRFYTRKHETSKEIIKRLSANNIRAEQKEARKIEKEAKDETKKVEKEATNKNGEAKEVIAETAAKNGEIAKKNGDSKSEKPKEAEKKEESKDKATPLCPRPAQNWSDFFFI